MAKKKKRNPTSIKTKLPNRKVYQRQSPQDILAIKDHRSAWRKLRVLISGFLGLLTVGGFLFLIYPRISVYPGESLNPSKPFQTPFVIKNDGYLPIRDINYSFVLNKVETENYLLIKDIEVGTSDVISWFVLVQRELDF